METGIHNRWHYLLALKGLGEYQESLKYPIDTSPDRLSMDDGSTETTFIIWGVCIACSVAGIASVLVWMARWDMISALKVFAIGSKARGQALIEIIWNLQGRIRGIAIRLD